tara:strand:- start:128 stop:439 length:312 start_codon:yes stop_codon:yes gene_type:complete
VVVEVKEQLFMLDKMEVLVEEQQELLIFVVLEQQMLGLQEKVLLEMVMYHTNFPHMVIQEVLVEHLQVAVEVAVLVVLVTLLLVLLEVVLVVMEFKIVLQEVE